MVYIDWAFPLSCPHLITTDSHPSTFCISKQKRPFGKKRDPTTLAGQAATTSFSSYFPSLSSFSAFNLRSCRIYTWENTITGHTTQSRILNESSINHAPFLSTLKHLLPTKRVEKCSFVRVHSLNRVAGRKTSSREARRHRFILGHVPALTDRHKQQVETKRSIHIQSGEIIHNSDRHRLRPEEAGITNLIVQGKLGRICNLTNPLRRHQNPILLAPFRNNHSHNQKRIGCAINHPVVPLCTLDWPSLLVENCFIYRKVVCWCEKEN